MSLTMLVTSESNGVVSSYGVVVVEVITCSSLQKVILLLTLAIVADFLLPKGVCFCGKIVLCVLDELYVGVFVDSEEIEAIVAVVGIELFHKIIKIVVSVCGPDIYAESLSFRRTVLIRTTAPTDAAYFAPG